MPGPETSVRFGPLRAASGRRHSHHVGLTQHVTQNVLAWMADTKLSGGPAIEIYGEKGVIIARGTDIASSRVMPDDIRCLQLYRHETGRVVPI